MSIIHLHAGMNPTNDVLSSTYKLLESPHTYAVTVAMLVAVETSGLPFYEGLINHLNCTEISVVETMDDQDHIHVYVDDLNSRHPTVYYSRKGCKLIQSDALKKKMLKGDLIWGRIFNEDFFYYGPRVSRR